MARGPKGFSEEEKCMLQDKLCLECEERWAVYGYKKTSISELTSSVGISAGAFYLLFPSKEAFFCETLIRLQNRLKAKLVQIITEEKGKSGFVKAMQWHFQEYERAPYLYDFNSPDFLAFLNKIPQERMETMIFDNQAFFLEIVELSELTFKVEKSQAYAVVSTLLYTVELKKQKNFDFQNVFNFLLESVMDDLFL